MLYICSYVYHKGDIEQIKRDLLVAISKCLLSKGSQSKSVDQNWLELMIKQDAVLLKHIPHKIINFVLAIV